MRHIPRVTYLAHKTVLVARTSGHRLLHAEGRIEVAVRLRLRDREALPRAPDLVEGVEAARPALPDACQPAPELRGVRVTADHQEPAVKFLKDVLAVPHVVRGP